MLFQKTHFQLNIEYSHLIKTDEEVSPEKRSKFPLPGAALFTPINVPEGSHSKMSSEHLVLFLTSSRHTVC